MTTTMATPKQAKKHRLVFTYHELRLLEGKLARIAPSDYSPQDYVTLGNLYGRITHILQRADSHKY